MTTLTKIGKKYITMTTVKKTPLCGSGTLSEYDFLGQPYGATEIENESPTTETWKRT